MIKALKLTFIMGIIALVIFALGFFIVDKFNKIPIGGTFVYSEIIEGEPWTFI